MRSSKTEVTRPPARSNDSYTTVKLYPATLIKQGAGVVVGRFDQALEVADV